MSVIMADMDQASIDVSAPPEVVYDLIADIPNLGRWSPETYRTEWIDGATTAEVGAKFKGWNQDKLGPIPLKWATVCTIKSADRGRELSFTVRESGATWSYRLEPSGAGTHAHRDPHRWHQATPGAPVQHGRPPPGPEAGRRDAGDPQADQARRREPRLGMTTSTD